MLHAVFSAFLFSTSSFSSSFFPLVVNIDLLVVLLRIFEVMANHKIQ